MSKEIPREARSCIKCGSTERDRWGRCRACLKARATTWYRENRDRVRGAREARIAAILSEPCVKCGAVDRTPSKGDCRPCAKAYRATPAFKTYMRKWREKHMTAEVNARRSAREKARKYGVSEEEQSRMLAQQKGRCAACGDLPAPGYRLCLDHDHVTKKVRGFLCLGCNIAEGGAKGSPLRLRKLALYLERHAPKLL
jgi:Recombination endonuclease VII